MSKLLSRHVVWGALFVLFLVPQVCRANPIVIDPVAIGGKALIFLFFNALVDLIVVTGGFALVQELCYVNVGDFPRYFLSVVVGGLVIDLIAIIITHQQLSFVALLTALVGYNTFLCRSFFRLVFAKAICIGLMVGILTNPFLWAILLPLESMSGNF